MSVFKNQPLTIHQFHYRSSAGDAVTRHMLFIQEALAEVGVTGKIFSIQRKNLPQGKVHQWKLDCAWDCDLLLIHHSQNNPELKQLLSMELPKAMIYHSQPPENYFTHDREARKNLRQGRSQLAWFRKRNVPALAVSKFSAGELKSCGFDSVSVLPLMHLSQQKRETTSSDEKEPRHLLFVGKIAPHKKQSLLIETFYHLRRELPAHSKLHLVGTGDPLYTKYLKLLIAQLGLKSQVSLTGKLTDSNLKEYYSLADAFICMSEYEGFCMPVVEAMKVGVPVFYRPLTGIKETMGGAGVELLSDDAVQNAMVIKTFLQNRAALQGVLEKQHCRLKILGGFQNRQNVQKELLKLCGRSLNNQKSHEASLSL